MNTAESILQILHNQDKENTMTNTATTISRIDFTAPADYTRDNEWGGQDIGIGGHIVRFATDDSDNISIYILTANGILLRQARIETSSPALLTHVAMHLLHEATA